jgi:hypothetical protein
MAAYLNACTSKTGREAAPPGPCVSIGSEFLATAPEASASTATATAAAPTAAAPAVLGLVHAKAASAQVRPVEGADRGLGRARIRHLDEGESPGASGLAIRDHVDGLHSAVLFEKRAELVLGGRERDISDVQLLAQLTFLAAVAGSRRCGLRNSFMPDCPEMGLLRDGSRA